MKIESAKQIGFDFCPDNCPYADIQHSETKLYAGEDVFSTEMNVYCGNKELCRMVYALVKQDKEVETTECDAINELKELKEYLLTEERIEAVDMAIAVLKKQIPKKPIEHEVEEAEDIKILGGKWREGTTVYRCECGNYVRIGMQYCYKCGQRIGWKGDSDESI